MKTTSILSRALVLLVASATASSVSAGEARKQNFRLPESVQIEGVKLDAGTYKIAWEGEGSDVQVSILKGGKVLVTTAAKVVDLKSKTADDMALMRPQENATPALHEIRLRNQSFGLSFAESAPAVADGGKAARPQAKSSK